MTRGRDSDGPMQPLPTVRPTAWTPRGEAAAKLPDGRTVVVWGGIPGEMAQVGVDHDGRQVIVTHHVRARSPSPDRVPIACDRYDRCGGCALMHVSPEAQKQARDQLIGDAMREHGVRVEPGEWFTGPDGDRDFRHVVKVGFSTTADGRLKMGAWGRNTREVVPIPDCLVVAPILRRTMARLAHVAREVESAAWDHPSGRGVLRAAVLRVSRATGEVLVTLVTTRRSPELSALAEALAAGIDRIVGVWLHINDDPGHETFLTDARGAVGVRPLVGQDTIEEQVDGTPCRIGPADFFQTNPGTAEVLVRRLRARLALGADDTVLDLFSGVGSLTLPLARDAGFALGVEDLESAVLRARESARLAGLTVEFIHERVEVALPALAARFATFRPTVLLNPARRGLEPEVVAGVVALQPRRIAYVSSNPSAMARDLAAFVDAGFKIQPLDRFDMFPHTAHVECIAILTAATPVATPSRAPKRRRVTA